MFLLAKNLQLKNNFHRKINVIGGCTIKHNLWIVILCDSLQLNLVTQVLLDAKFRLNLICQKIQNYSAIFSFSNQKDKRGILCLYGKFESREERVS